MLPKMQAIGYKNGELGDCTSLSFWWVATLFLSGRSSGSLMVTDKRMGREGKGMLIGVFCCT